MKNETVIGTMGKTHGVSSAAKPQRIASMMSDQSEPLPAASLAGAAAVSAPAVVSEAPATLPEVAAVSLTRSVAAAGVATLSPPAGAAVASAAPP